jgi:hypothetical protein
MIAGGELGRLDVQSIVGFALGGEQRAIFGEDLLEHRHAEGAPQAVALRRIQTRLPFAPEDDHRVGQR